MYFKYLLLLFILSQIEARDRPSRRDDYDDYGYYGRRLSSRNDCKLPHLRHGKATKTGFQRSQRIKFTCDDGYHLVGNKYQYATCRNSKWRVRVPSCERDDYRSSWGHIGDDCELPTLKHGTIRTTLSSAFSQTTDLRSSGDIIMFTCDKGYQLVGNKFAECRNSEWDVPIPSCASEKGVCPIPKIEKSKTFTRNNGALIEIFCIPGYDLVGSSAIYCDGDKWNETVPSCVETKKPTILSCDFEDSNICGWKQDELHDFDWKRTNVNTPSSILFTGPTTDHTLGSNGTGYYMYIDSTSRIENDTARLISPIYEGKLTKNGCFSFYYNMFGMWTGGLRIYQKPENMTMETIIALPKTMKQEYILFEKWGNQGDDWYRGVSQLNSSMDDFQIIIEGIKGKTLTSDIAIDDVAILQDENCTVAEETVSTPATIMPDSCSGRCNIAGVPETELGCGCTTACIAEENCCPDFFDICIFDSTNSTDDKPDAEEEPLTKKLEASTTPTATITKSPTKTLEPSKITSTTRLPTKETTIITAKSLSNEATTIETSTLKVPTIVFKTTTKVYNDKVTLHKENITTNDFKPTKSNITMKMANKVECSPHKTVVPNPESTTDQKIQVSSATRRFITRMTAKSLSQEATTIETSTLKVPNVVFEITTQVNNDTGTLHKENSNTKSDTTMKMAANKFESLQRANVVANLEATKGQSVQEKKVTEEPKRSSGLKTGLIISAALLCITAGAAWLIMTTKTVRRRIAMARSRGHTTMDTEVRYLNTDVDDDN